MTQHAATLRAAVIGDVIGSRQAEDREHLQQSLRSCLAGVNEMVDAVQPLSVTLGDEFQGAYSAMGEALRATLLLQATLKGTADLKIGIGWGELYFGDERSPLDQDGPCWWHARDALDSLRERAGRHGVPQSRRTACLTGTASDDLIEGYLSVRDHIVSELDALDGQILIGLASGRTQSELAADLGLNKSSISRRVHGHGIQSLIHSVPRRLPEEVSP
ncbi:MAG: SatD family protein [Acidimicrobiia bacterium]